MKQVNNKSHLALTNNRMHLHHHLSHTSHLYLSLSYPTLLFLHPLLSRRRPYPLQPLHMLQHDRHILLPQRLDRILRAIPPIIKAMRTISIGPSQKLGQTSQYSRPRRAGFLLALVILGHDPFHAHQMPQPLAGNHIEQVRVQKPPQHEHEPPNDVRMDLRPSVPIAMTGDRLEERTMQHHELDVHERAVGRVERIHGRGMAERLVAVGDLLGSHAQPFVLAVHPVRSRIVLVAGGEAGPFHQDVLLAVVGTRVGHDVFDEFGIVDRGRDLEPPRFDFGVVEPSEETGLQSPGVRVDAIAVPLMLSQIFDDGHEAVMSGALDSEDVHDLTILTTDMIYGGEVLLRGGYLLRGRGDVLVVWCVGVGAEGYRFGIGELIEIDGEAAPSLFFVEWGFFRWWIVISKGRIGCVLLCIVRSICGVKETEGDCCHQSEQTRDNGPSAPRIVRSSQFHILISLCIVPSLSSMLGNVKKSPTAIRRYIVVGIVKKCSVLSFVE